AFFRIIFSTVFVLGATFLSGRASADDAAADLKSADAAPVVELSVRVGFNGVYKSGFQTPTVVAWTGADGVAFDKITLETLDSDGTPFRFSREITAAENAAKRVETTATFPKACADLTVCAFSGEKMVCEKVFKATSKRASDSPTVFLPPASASKPIYLVIGDEKLGVVEAFGELRWREERRPNVVKVASAADLPLDFTAYDAVERLIITTTEPDFFADESCAARFDAVARWVERGGDVALVAGENSIPLLSADGLLAWFSPGNAVAPKTHEFRVVNSLATELKNVKNLALTGAKAFPFLKVPVVSNLKPDVIVEMREAETPLLTARPVGLGTIVYFAADLSTPPFSNWSGRGRLWLKILGFDAEAANVKTTTPGCVKRGFNDISGQMRGVMDKFEGVRVAPFSIVLVAIFVFLMAIGPLDWYLAKKVFKKPAFAWLTFPVYVVVFCAAVVFVLRRTRPDETIVNVAEVLDVDAESGVIRDTAWIGVYSPESRGIDVAFRPAFEKFSAQSDGGATGLNAAETSAKLAPLTLDGAGIGGADEKSVSLKLWDAPYEVATSPEAAKLVGAPFPTRSSKSFAARLTSKLNAAPTCGSLSDDGLSLRGSVVNPFDVPIYSAYVVYAGGAYYLGTLAPGETPIVRTMTRLEPLRVLNDHKVSIPTDRAANWDSTSYNLDSTRAPYILRTLSFYQFCGGEDSLGVAKRLQGDVDLSDLLRCGRAIIFGTIVDPEAELYRPAAGPGRAADAVELENLTKRLAQQRGEKTQTASEAAIEKYGEYGTSEDFGVASVDLGDAAAKVAGKRSLVARIIVPLKRGAEAERP
ncbi:MAG: hypothetical protein HUK22_08645, partial [Thermoguttaceae bacterium]|nr:hypothetical protein [Thermoguttaceae bacterium]